MPKEMSDNSLTPSKSFISHYYCKVRAERITFRGAHVHFDVPESYPVGDKGLLLPPANGGCACPRERKREGFAEGLQEHGSVVVW